MWRSQHRCILAFLPAFSYTIEKHQYKVEGYLEYVKKQPCRRSLKCGDIQAPSTVSVGDSTRSSTSSSSRMWYPDPTFRRLRDGRSRMIDRPCTPDHMAALRPKISLTSALSTAMGLGSPLAVSWSVEEVSSVASSKSIKRQSRHCPRKPRRCRTSTSRCTTPTE